MSIYKNFPLMGESCMPFVLLAAPTGSRVICDPPPFGTDEDWIILAESEKLHDWLSRNGWEYEGGYASSPLPVRGEFCSFRKEAVNLIVTTEKDFWSSFNLATEVARRLNLLEKKDRVMLFQAILYGNAPEG